MNGLTTHDSPLVSNSPYFNLASPNFLRSATPPTLKLPQKSEFKSIIDIFGELAKMDDDSQANFLLRLLSYSAFEPDFSKMAKGLQIQQGASM